MGVCRWPYRLRTWDSIGFRQDGVIRFDNHTCPPERRRRDLARDAKLEAERDPR